MSVTYPAPQGLAPAAPPAAVDRARHDRLRTTQSYQRTASAAELEADLGMLRAHEAMAGPTKSSLVGIAAAMVAGGFVLALALASTVHPGAGVPPLLLGLLCGGYVAIQSARLASLRRDKLEAASSLLRRLDLAPDTEVTLLANLRPGQGNLTQSRDLASNFWQGTSSEALLFQDPWLTMSGRLANGVGFKVTRTSMTFQKVDKRQGHQKTYIRTATQWAFQDAVELQYDPARNPQLPAAGPAAAGALRIGPEYQLLGFSNQPGTLSLTAGTSPRATETNDVGLIANLLAQATNLVDGSRLTVLVDREAWPAELATEAELKRRGPSGSLRAVLPTPLGAAGSFLVLLGVLASLVGVNGLMDHSKQQMFAQGTRDDIQSGQAKLAKLPAKSPDREFLTLKLKSDKDYLKRVEGRVDEALALGAGGGLGGLLMLGGGVALLLRDRKRAAAVKS